MPAEEDPIDEDALAELMKPKFQSHIYPDSVIYVRGDDNFLRKRAKALSVEANLKWDPENLERRLQKFHAENNISLFIEANNHADLGLPTFKQPRLPITRFFQENKTEVFEIDCNGSVFEIFESMRVYIERNGRPYNYLSSVHHLNDKRLDYLTQEEKDALDEEASQEAFDKNTGEEKKRALEALADGRLEALEQHFEDLKKQEKLYMRQFLMKAIIPVLTEGMIDVWRVGPTDPVDYLAEYIFKKSNELAK